MFRYKK